MLRPKEAIRRFDVFAEYSRQDALKDGMAPDQAKGYGIWLAKVVAARRNGRSSTKQVQSKSTDSHATSQKAPGVSKWRTLNGIPQSDELFDKEIVTRMGKDFYSQVMVPAIGRAIEEGESYTTIRDKIRKDWIP